MSNNTYEKRSASLRDRWLRSLLLGGSGFALLATAAPALADEDPDVGVSEADAAQPSADEEERLRKLGIVTVTARRKEESLKDAPVAITALSGDMMDDYAVNDFMDISTQVPTMIAGRAASGSSASIFLRGVGSTALSAGFDQSVSFNIDGVPMSRGREISMPQYDIERTDTDQKVGHAGQDDWTGDHPVIEQVTAGQAGDENAGRTIDGPRYR